jgi:sec-independent protein translocase protein TatC
MKRSDGRLPQAAKLFDHIRELQMRLIMCTVVLVVAGVIIYFFYEPILALLRSPLNAPLYYSNPAGSFAFIMKICLMGAIAIAIPVIVYNLIMFIVPAFTDKLPMKRVYFTTAFSIIMAAAGAVFAFTCILPGTLRFFGGFQVGGLHALISADSYLNFVTNMIITFVIVFQLPLLIAFIDTIKPLPPKKMLKMEKWVILGSLIVAALVPFAFDLMTCLLIALPIVVLYNLSIALVVVQHIIINHKKLNAVKSVVVKPVINQEYATELLPSFNDIATELISNNQTIAAQPAKLKHSFMDIRTVNPSQLPVRPIKTTNQMTKKVMVLGNQVRLISDINRYPQINRASA